MHQIDLTGIDWVVVGGETDQKGRHRPVEEKWVLDIRDMVKGAGLPFLFKHWPGTSHNSKEALLAGRTWAEYPKELTTNVDWSTVPKSCPE